MGEEFSKSLLIDSDLPVKPQASAKRKVLQDIKKKRPVSSNWNSRNLVNFVT